MQTTSFAFRVWHQLTLEWRAQWFLVLLWLGALATGCWQALQDERPEIAMPGSLPALLALIIIVRSVRADAPGNAEVASHARPLGRGAVWLAKVAFFKLALLLPWLACAWPECRGYGFGAVEWVAEIAGRALPALLLGSFAALTASWSGSARKNVALGGAGLVGLVLMMWMLNKTGTTHSERCVLAVAGVVLSVALVLAWWQKAMTRRARMTLVVGGVATVLVATLGDWNWRAKPSRRYADAKLGVHCGERPAGAAQELWEGMYVTGLPADHVASVVAFAPVGEAWPPEAAFSDHTWLADAEKGKVRARGHWMVMAHTRALVPHYPAGALWHGNKDAERVEVLKRAVGTTTPGPWRLRLAVQRMTRVATMPLRVALRGEKRIVLDTGRRLDFALSELSSDSEMRFWGKLRRRFPLLAPVGEQERLRVAGAFPEENFLVLLHSPGIHEVRTACEEDSNHSSAGGLLHHVHNRDAGFNFPHPRAQMDIAGLKLDEWIADTTLDLWWGEERGVTDVEISAEELARAMAKQ
ncbi:MAG: hypothetical protein ACO1TE_08395 [Prosthecobacter sp.]